MGLEGLHLPPHFLLTSSPAGNHCYSDFTKDQTRLYEVAVGGFSSSRCWSLRCRYLRQINICKRKGTEQDWAEGGGELPCRSSKQPHRVEVAHQDRLASAEVARPLCPCSDQSPGVAAPGRA